MAKYKSYTYSQTVMLPVSLKDQLAHGTIEFAIHTLVEEIMDMTRFDAKFKNDETGCKAYNPKILLKIILLAYARGIIHSRKIERECWSGTFPSLEEKKEKLKKQAAVDYNGISAMF